MDTSFLDKAIIFAVSAHQGVGRKGKNFPYIIHPLESLSIAATMTDDSELLAATVLHDVIEDTSVTYQDLQSEFGERVAYLVQMESDIVVENMSRKDSWKIRKQAMIERLSKASRDVQIVALSDKLSNARTIYRDYLTMGDKVWNLFNIKERELHEWHYRGLVSALKNVSDTWAYKEFSETVDKIFAS